MDLSYLRGIVFDLDGTLADSRLNFDAMRAETGCPQGTGLLEYIDQLQDQAEQQQTLAVINHYEMLGAQAATWITGAEPVLVELRERGLPIGIFTRNSRRAARLMIDALSIPCDHLVARENAPAKPNPAGLHQIARGWQLAPAQLLCVGDFLYDLEAAANAGMLSGLYDPGGDSPHGEHADFTFQHFDQLAALLFEEPHYD